MTKYEPTRMRPKRSAQVEREVRRNTNLRQARTCYGHLAGVAGIALMEELRRLKWVEESATYASGNRVGYGLTAEGRLAMNDMGVDLAAADKSTGNFAFGCLDWTERGHHLGGALGRVLTTCVAERGLVSRTPGSREVTLQGSPSAWFR